VESASTEINQTEFFKQLAATSVRFLWGRSLRQVLEGCRESSRPPLGTSRGRHDAEGHYSWAAERVRRLLL